MPYTKLTLFCRFLALTCFFIFFQPFSAMAGQREIIILEQQVPIYSSLQEAKTGKDPLSYLQVSSVPGEMESFPVREEKDGWLKLDDSEWVEASKTVPLERFLSDPTFGEYTTCSEELPRSFPVPLGPGKKEGRVTMTAHPTVQGGMANIEIFDASGTKLWSSADPENLARKNGRLFAQCRGDKNPGSSNWVRAAGDLDGDGHLEILTGVDPVHGVSPADFSLYRWDGKKPVFLGTFSLQETQQAKNWRLRAEGVASADHKGRLVFARANARQNADGTVDFPIANWDDLLTGVARMRLAPSGEHFSLMQWENVMGSPSFLGKDVEMLPLEITNKTNQAIKKIELFSDKINPPQVEEMEIPPGKTTTILRPAGDEIRMAFHSDNGVFSFPPVSFQEQNRDLATLELMQAKIPRLSFFNPNGTPQTRTLGDNSIWGIAQGLGAFPYAPGKTTLGQAVAWGGLKQGESGNILIGSIPWEHFTWNATLIFTGTGPSAVLHSATMRSSYKSAAQEEIIHKALSRNGFSCFQKQADGKVLRIYEGEAQKWEALPKSDSAKNMFQRFAESSDVDGPVNHYVPDEFFSELMTAYKKNLPPKEIWNKSNTIVVSVRLNNNEFTITQRKSTIFFAAEKK